MNAKQFSHRLDDAHKRAAQLYQQANAAALQQPEQVEESLEELHVALEELQVAEEELLQQNEELAIARIQVEAERQRYYDLFQFAPDGYVVTDEAGMIREANRAAAKLLNVPPEFLIRKLLINFIPLEDRQTFRAKLNQLLQNDWMQEWELRVLPRKGETFDAAVSVSIVRNLQGEADGCRWLLRDITERKQTEEKVRRIELQNLQLQEAARLKSHFLAIMSHELRSPMNAIIGFSQLLLRQHQQSLAKTQENMVERILNSGRHLLTLIDEILDFSKIEVGCLQLQLEELNLAELVRATTEEILPLAEQNNLALQANLNLQNPYVFNDRVRLRQILINLLSNAIKFTDFGNVQVDVWELPSNQIAIAVKDTGIGIAEADIQHIFQEFRQLNQTITRKHGGTGLGLAIVERLVSMMRGKITVESKLDRGSTFRIELPRQVSPGLKSQVNSGNLLMDINK